MNKKNSKIEQARNLLVQLALDEIYSEENFNYFYRHVYYVIAKLGLLRKAEEEQLFSEKKEWSNPEYKGYLIKKLKEFLVRHIR